jgi:sugar phosphate isomerase/epimerase
MTTLSRRSFFGTTGAMGLTLFELQKLWSDGAPGGQPDYAWLPMGIQSYSLRGFSQAEAIEHTVKLGLHYIELFEGHCSTSSDPSQIEELKKQLRRGEIAPSAHGVNRFTSDHDLNRKLFDFANRLGIRNLSADPDADAFDSLDRLVAEYGIRIAIHNHGPGHRYAKIADVKKAVSGHHRWIGACADLGHFIRSSEDPIEAIEALGDRLYGVHLKDFAEPKAKTQGVILGQGHLDVAGVFQALRKVRFPADGALSLEYEEKPENPIQDLERCLEVARDAAAKVARD